MIHVTFSFRIDNSKQAKYMPKHAVIHFICIHKVGMPKNIHMAIYIAGCDLQYIGLMRSAFHTCRTIVSNPSLRSPRHHLRKCLFKFSNWLQAPMQKNNKYEICNAADRGRLYYSKEDVLVCERLSDWIDSVQHNETYSI